jgi:GTP cyclohydrolase I
MKQLELLTKANGNMPRTAEEKLQMIDQAAIYYGQFLNALGFDWEKDPHSANTPKRVAKAWINDLIAGSVGEEPVITSFPNDEGYTGLICQTRIPVISMCGHHNLQFLGLAHVAYIPGTGKTDQVIGLSKLNRIVDFYSRRPQVQESLTKQIHDHVDKLCIGNRGVAVVIESQHNCVRCRGLNHESVMKTSQLSQYFFTNEIGTRQEFFSLIENSRL